jgi:hypothetical protein
MSRIAEYIRKLAEAEEVGIEAFLGTVTAVDEEARTCNVQPLLDDAEFINVWLQGSSESDEGLVVIPAVGSDVVCIAIDDFQAVVINTTSVDKILIDSPLVEFNGGDNGGLINISDLQTQIGKLNSSLTALKNIINAMVPIPGDGGAALKTALTAWTVQTADLSNITDDKITH